jgi:hypothetical protein
VYVKTNRCGGLLFCYPNTGKELKEVDAEVFLPGSRVPNGLETGWDNLPILEKKIFNGPKA